MWIYKTALLCRCSVCSFTVPIANYPEEVPALLMLTLLVQLSTALQNPACFRFSPASPSFLFLDCCWSHSVEEGCLGLYPLLSALGPYACPRKPFSRTEQNYSLCGAIGILEIPVGNWAVKETVPGQEVPKAGAINGDSLQPL